MARVDRLLVGLPLLAVVLLVLGRTRPSEAEVAAGPTASVRDHASAASPSTRERAPEEIARRAAAPSATHPTLAGDLTSLRAGFDRIRRAPAAIDPEEASALGAIAERLCTRFGRCDARDVLAYYSALAPDARRLGLEEDARFEALRLRVIVASKQNLDASAWSPVREEILAGLREIAARAGDAADCVPAARASSLSARLGMERIQSTHAADEDAAFLLRERVEEEARAALAIYGRAGFVTPRLEPIWVLASLDLAAGDSERARAGFEECLASAEHVGDLDYREKALVGLIRIARDAGDVEAARRSVLELARFRSAKTSWPLARWHAEYLLQRDEAEAAIAFLEAHEPEDRRDRTSWHLELAAAARRAGDLERARRHVGLVDPEATSSDELVLARSDLALAEGRTLEVVETLLEPGVLERLPRLKRAQANALVGEAFFHMQRYEAAIGPLEDALEIGARWQTRLEAQRDANGSTTSVLGEQIGLHAVARLAECLARTGAALEAARVIEAHQSSMLRSAVGRNDDEAPLERASAREDASAGVVEHDASDSDPAGPAVAADVSGDLVVHASDRAQSLLRGADAFSSADIRAWAAAFDLGLVTWVVGADSSVVAHVARDGSARAEPIVRGRRALESAVRRLRESAIAGDAAATARLARELRAAILPDAIFDALRAEARGRILFLLHGPLEALPVELLLELELGSDELVPLVLPGLPTRGPGLAVDRAALSAWTLLGSPLDASGAALLPGARDELLAISRMRGMSLAPALAIDGAFDRPALARALAGGGALHVATHLARCADGPGRFAPLGLLLSDGDVFDAREIAAARPALPLAVLAACETAAGRFVDAEGLQGVARAFLESGTRNLLVTLWPVADEAGRTYSIAFHRALIAGARPSEAASGARRELREHGVASAEWAAFRLLGRD